MCVCVCVCLSVLYMHHHSYTNMKEVRYVCICVVSFSLIENHGGADITSRPPGEAASE